MPANIQSRDYLFTRDIKDTYGADRTIQYYRLTAIDSLKSMQNIKAQLDKWINRGGQIKNINESLITCIFGYDVASKIYSKKAQKNTASALVPQDSINQVFA